ncbi:MAG: hypothetical protein ABL931_10465 [Usitatibacteraceae bacterium]
MNRKPHIANSLLWAVAIIASALVGAPPLLSLILLPALAAMSLLLGNGQRGRDCARG